DAWTFALVDLEQSLDGTNPKLIAQAWFRSGTDVADVPRVIEFAQNGAFVALATAQGGPWTLPHSASATGEAYLASTGDRMGVAVSKARGLAITPMLSVIAPRPGQPIVGEQALHVLVRDPSVSSLDFEMDDWTCSAPVVENLAWGCTLEHGMPGDLVITAQPAGWTHTVSYLL
ncbi:MAG TPA: hypothetical protein QGF58_04000, partial [Myxococcota bacterium]|nr:hypothetical protein [Myxococcota bacterium]